MSLQSSQNHSEKQRSPERSTGNAIYIVGPRRLQNEAIASCLEREIGDQCFVLGDVKNLPLEGQEDQGRQRLILLDCQGKGQKNVLAELRPYLRQKRPENHVALFNVSRDSGIEKKCVAEGIRGFFYEEDQLENLLKGVRAVFDGDWWLSREVMIKCILEGTDEDISSKRANEILTSRQIEILAQVAVGASNDEIAEKLCVSPHTVKTHLYNVFKKIKVANRLQAALWAAKHL
ncbi:MAG: response regulator transcription factor [Syntrophobacteria bacterium]|nr:response regulator transcription factor [Deltaproteobacteria bacterium]